MGLKEALVTTKVTCFFNVFELYLHTRNIYPKNHTYYFLLMFGLRRVKKKAVLKNTPLSCFILFLCY